jgi:hypothetical protein
MDLVYYLPHRLYETAEISSKIDPVHAAFAKMFNPSISLSDRSGIIACPPIGMRILDPLPSRWYQTETFAHLCRHRYDEVLALALSGDKKLIIFYSGGIDSTLIAALAISHPNWANHKEHVYLAFSNDSIRENPGFWNTHLRREFSGRMLNSTAYHQLMSDPGNLCITGEFADNLFGSLTLKSYMDVAGDGNLIHRKFIGGGLSWMLNKIDDTKHRPRCEEMILALLQASPRQLTSNHECFWWLNFILKWQAVKYRLASHSPDDTMVNQMIQNTIHFFETADFQNWAVTTNESKVENTWNSYKMPAKQIIFEVNHDEEYLRYKTKYPSIPGLTRYGNTWSFIYLDDNGCYHPSLKIRT